MNTSLAPTTECPVELRSDTFTLPTPHMLEAMTYAELGDDCYGEDPTVNALECRAAELLGKEAACFMPSGTMANLISIMAHCPRGTQVLAGAESDIFVHEAGGASVCGGIIYRSLPNQSDGTIALADIESAFPADPGNPEFAMPALLCLENPHNRCGGRVLPLAYLSQAAACARRHGAAVHLDGARIFNAAVACGIPADKIAEHADSVQFCLSKGLSAPAGSMLAGSGEFIDAARRLRKMLGGGMRQAGVLAGPGLVALEEMMPRLAEDHRNATRLAAGLAQLHGVRVDAAHVETNMVYCQVTAMSAEELVRRAAARGVRVLAARHDTVRLVTHAGVTSEQVDRAVEAFRTVLSEVRPPSELRRPR